MTMSLLNLTTLRDLLTKYRPHRELASASLIDKLATARAGTDPWTLELTDEERTLLGRVLADNPQVPTAKEVTDAVTLLLHDRLTSQAQHITGEIAKAEERGDMHEVADLMVVKQIVRRLLERLEE